MQCKMNRDPRLYNMMSKVVVVVVVVVVGGKGGRGGDGVGGGGDGKGVCCGVGGVVVFSVCAGRVLGIWWWYLVVKAVVICQVQVY